MRTIFTHLRPDLDAVSSVWFYKRFVLAKDEEAKLTFVPANWNGAEMQPGDVALDIEAGGKGEKGAKLSDGRVMSCFAGLVESHGTDAQYAILRPVVEFVDAQDSTGDAFTTLLSGVAECPCCFLPFKPRREQIPASIRIGSLESMFRVMERLAKEDYHETVRRFSEILDAIYESGLDLQEAEKEAKLVEMIGPVAFVNSMSKNPHLHPKVFAKRDARVIVRLDASNLCVLRRDTEKMNLGKIVRPFVEKNAPDELVGDEKWFFHPAGYLAARGTLKAPAKALSRVDARALAQHIANSI